jgi:putative transposase
MRLNAELNSIKREAYPWMAELPWVVTNTALSDLGVAYQNFFRRLREGSKPGYPKFKKKGRNKEAFAVEARNCRFDKKKVRLPKLGWVRLCESLRWPGKVLSIRISKEAGKWFLSAQIELDQAVWSYPHLCENQAVVGIDLGLVDLCILSTGHRVKAPRTCRLYEVKLRRLNRELSRRQKGSSNWHKTKLKLQKVHQRIRNIRHDLLHRVSSALVRCFRWIGLEDLNVKGLARGRLAKSVHDAAWSELRRQLEYKAPLAGSNLVFADRFFASSKTCSVCGQIVDSLPLSVRDWTCDCGAHHDRDQNAAENLKQLAAAQAVTACGEERAGSALRHRTKRASMKQESSSYVNQ